jgi:hypothetical protein
MNDPNPSRWAGLCAGGFFAAAAVYVGNVVAMAAIRAEDLLLILAMGTLTVACLVMGCLVLSARHWAPRLSVVVAAAFAAVHFVGLVYLFLTSSPSAAILTRSLQWQLGTAFLLLWLSVLGFAFRLVRCLELSGDLTRAGNGLRSTPAK